MPVTIAGKKSSKVGWQQLSKVGWQWLSKSSHWKWVDSNVEKCWLKVGDSGHWKTVDGDMIGSCSTTIIEGWQWPSLENDRESWSTTVTKSYCQKMVGDGGQKLADNDGH